MTGQELDGAAWGRARYQPTPTIIEAARALYSRHTGDADLRLRGGRWAYRVLLTRARQGMVVSVPPGDSIDPTRLPGFYDETFAYLRGIGLHSL